MSNIKFGTPVFCTRIGDDVKFKVTSFNFDIQLMRLNIVVEYGLKVEQLNLDIHEAINIGLIDLSKLKPFTDLMAKRK